MHFLITPSEPAQEIFAPGPALSVLLRASYYLLAGLHEYRSPVVLFLDQQWRYSTVCIMVVIRVPVLLYKQPVAITKAPIGLI